MGVGERAQLTYAFLFPHPSGHVDSNARRLFQSLHMRQSTHNEHAVQSQRPAVFCAYHLRFIRGGGGEQRLPIPRPSLGDRVRFLLLPFSNRGRTEGWGKVVPGDFTLFEASVFRYCRCHPRGFSLLLHRHLPPSPVGRAGKPGKGVVVH